MRYPKRNCPRWTWNWRGLQWYCQGKAQVFTDDEMGKFTHLVSVSQNSSNPKKEFTDCINVIDNEYKKQNSKSTSEMNDDDFRNFFSKKNT